MSKEMEELRRTFQQRFGGSGDTVFQGVVTEVNEEEFTCTVQRDGQVDYFDVRLRGLVNAELQGFAFIPKLQSTVLVCRIGKSNELFVCMFTEIDKMYLLAFVSKYQDVDQFADLDFNDLPVYNATMAKFGENTQVVNIEEDFVENNSAVLRVDGNNVRVNGDFDRIEVYDMSGRLVETLGAPAYTFTLSNGFYVARIVSGNHVKTQKLAVY